MINHNPRYPVAPTSRGKTSHVVVALAISVSVCFVVLIGVVMWWCCRYDRPSLE